MSSEFMREERYIVFKMSDLGNSLKGDEIRRLAREYAEHRQRLRKKPLECVVVEKDWPEYEPTWRAIEARTTGAQPALTIAEQDQINAAAAIRSVYGAQPAPEVLSDLTSLLREATDILKWYGNGLHIKRLSGRIDWDAERAKLSRENFEHSFEAYDGTEYYVEDGSRAYQLVDKLENALDLTGNINNAQPALSVPEGGGKLVPVEPTPKMQRALINGANQYDSWDEGYRDMLAAAPEAKP